jgi:hypothetical protein
MYRITFVLFLALSLPGCQTMKELGAKTNNRVGEVEAPAPEPVSRAYSYSFKTDKSKKSGLLSFKLWAAKHYNLKEVTQAEDAETGTIVIRAIRDCEKTYKYGSLIGGRYEASSARLNLEAKFSDRNAKLDFEILDLRAEPEDAQEIANFLKQKCLKPEAEEIEVAVNGS